jgi:hypothetical protein
VDNYFHLGFITAYVDNLAHLRRFLSGARFDQARLPGQEALAAVPELEVLDDELDDELDELDESDEPDEPEDESDELEGDAEGLDSDFFSAEPPVDTPEPARLSVR